MPSSSSTPSSSPPFPSSSAPSAVPATERGCAGQWPSREGSAETAKLRGLPKNRVFRQVNFLTGLLSKSRLQFYFFDLFVTVLLAFPFCFSNFLSHDIKNQRGRRWTNFSTGRRARRRTASEISVSFTCSLGRMAGAFRKLAPVHGVLGLF